MFITSFLQFSRDLHVYHQHSFTVSVASFRNLLHQEELALKIAVITSIEPLLMNEYNLE